MRAVTISVLLLTLLMWERAIAVPACPDVWQDIPVPNGSISATLQGDERGYSWIARDGHALSMVIPSAADHMRPHSYARAPGVPAVGTALVYVVAVSFPDVEGDGTVADLLAELDESVGVYYETISRGQLLLDFRALHSEWIPVNQNLSYYGADGTGVDNANGPIFELAREALVGVDPYVDFSTLDLDGNQELDAGELHLLVVHSGDDQAFTGISSDIWSHRWWIYGETSGYSDTFLDGIRVSEPQIWGNETSPGYALVARHDRLGVMCHELLHCFGAPDLYDVGGNPQTPVGPWSLMDIGVWLGTPSGTAPCRPGSYLEWDVDADPSNGVSGWIEAKKAYDGEHLISRLGGETGVELLQISTPISSEYFLVENRQQNGIDCGLIEAGILIYHIDESQPVNNDESNPPYRVWLEDPGRRAQKRGAAYSADDGPDQAAFTPATEPSSDSNRGEPTNIAITSIGLEGEEMTFLLAGAGGTQPGEFFLAWPVPITPGAPLTALLPEIGGQQGVLSLYNLGGRRVAARNVIAGSYSYRLDLPHGLSAGAYALVYKSSATSYSLPLVVAPEP